MPKIKLIFFISLALSILILSFFFIKNFRIDASSDTLVAQNDKDFEYSGKLGALLAGTVISNIGAKISNDNWTLIKEKMETY